MTDTSDLLALQRFYRVHNACVQLEFAAESIYSDGFSDADVRQMKKSGGSGPMTNSILASPASHIATHIKNAQKKLDIPKVMSFYNLEASGTACDEFVRHPLLLHSSIADVERFDSELLTAMGDSWLQSLVLLILAQRFPMASGAAIAELADRLRSSTNCFGKKWQDNDPSAANLPSFTQYIGALAMDRARGGFQLEEVRVYIESSIQEEAIRISTEPHMCRGLYAKSPKYQLMKLLQALGEKKNVEFTRRKGGSAASITVDIMLGGECIGTGTGPSMSAAEKSAAEVALQRYPQGESVPRTVAKETIAPKTNGSVVPAPKATTSTTPAPKAAKPEIPVPKISQPNIAKSKVNGPTAPLTANNIKMMHQGAPGSLDPSKDGYSVSRGSRSSSVSARSSTSSSSDRPKRIMGIKGLRQKDQFTLRMEERKRVQETEAIPVIETALTVHGAPSFDDSDDEDSYGGSVTTVARSRKPLYTRPAGSQQKVMPKPWQEPRPSMRIISYSAYTQQQTQSEQPAVKQSRYGGGRVGGVKTTLRIESATVKIPEKIPTKPAANTVNIPVKPVVASAVKTPTPTPAKAKVPAPTPTPAKPVIKAPIRTPTPAKPVVNTPAPKQGATEPEKDAKNKLEALLSSKSIGTVEYFTKFMGPGRFHTVCRLQSDPSSVLGEGEWKSKDLSQQMAATNALLNQDI